MDLQILYNNPTKEQNKERAMGKFKRTRRNPVNVYRKAKRDLGTKDKPNKVSKGPGIKLGKIDFPGLKERDKYQEFMLNALRDAESNIKDPAKQKRAVSKLNKRNQAYRTSLAKLLKRLNAEEARMNEKGYILDKGLTKKEAISKLREEQRAAEKAEKDAKKMDEMIKKVLRKEKSQKAKALGKIDKKKRKKVSKKARKKTAKKASKKATKKTSKRGGKKPSYRKKNNPGIQILSNPMAIEVLDNPKKTRKKASKKARKKAAKKAAKKSTKKSSKKSAKKSTKKSSKKASKKKDSKKKSSKKKNIKSAALDQVAPKKKKSHKSKGKGKKAAKGHKKGKSSHKKGKHKIKSNPERGEVMADKSKFQQITKHDGMEATGLVVGGSLIKLYNHFLKSKVSNAPVISSVYKALPASAVPAFDGIIDVLLAAGVGHLASFAAKKAGKFEAPAESFAKGLIGAAVVSFAMKATQSVGNATGAQMSGYIEVPSMSGIVAIPEMDGIVAVPEMEGYGEADFGAILATPEMEDMGEADFGEADFGEADFGEADFGEYEDEEEYEG